MALKLGELVANWRQIYTVKEGADWPAFTVAVLAWWIRSVVADNPLVVNVGFNDHLGKIIVVLSRQEVDRLLELREARLQVTSLYQGAFYIPGEFERNLLIFSVGQGDLLVLDTAEALCLKLENAAA